MTTETPEPTPRLVKKAYSVHHTSKPAQIVSTHLSPFADIESTSTSFCYITEDEILVKNLPMPPHMHLIDWGRRTPRPVSLVLRALFTALCTISYGHQDLTQVWLSCNDNDKDWLDRKERLATRISNVTIVGALLVSASAAFLTTTPPKESLVDFNQQGPYICLLLSFGLTLGGLVIGSSLLYAMPIVQGPWFKETLMCSRSHVCCTLVFVTYPFITIAISTVVMAMGLLAACWNSQNSLIRDTCTFVLLVPMSMIMLFVWTQLPFLKALIWPKSLTASSNGSNSAA